MKQSVSLKIFGEVQGVNLRSMIKLKALELKLTGLVRNNQDGSVTVKAEGDKKSLEDLIAWLNKSPSFSKVTGIEDYWSEYKGEYHDFIIDYTY